MRLRVLEAAICGVWECDGIWHRAWWLCSAPKCASVHQTQHTRRCFSAYPAAVGTPSRNRERLGSAAVLQLLLAASVSMSAARVLVGCSVAQVCRQSFRVRGRKSTLCFACNFCSSQQLTGAAVVRWCTGLHSAQPRLSQRHLVPGVLGAAPCFSVAGQGMRGMSSYGPALRAGYLDCLAGRCWRRAAGGRRTRGTRLVCALCSCTSPAQLRLATSAYSAKLPQPVSHSAAVQLRAQAQRDWALLGDEPAGQHG